MFRTAEGVATGKEPITSILIFMAEQEWVIKIQRQTLGRYKPSDKSA